MLINVTVHRTASQSVRASLRTWTVCGQGRLLADVEWDPAGPLSGPDAAREALVRLVRELDRTALPSS